MFCTICEKFNHETADCWKNKSKRQKKTGSNSNSNNDEQEDEELRIIAEQAGMWRLGGDKLCQVWHIDEILFVCVVFKQQWDIGEW